MSDNWYQDFFHGLAVELWALAIPPEQTRGEVDFLIDELQVAPGDALLDVPCGHGRHAVELAWRGFHVTGVDISSEALNRARSAGEDVVGNLMWVQADMLTMPELGPFDGAMCLGNSFGYLNAAGTRQFLASVARSLKPGAKFIIECGALAETILPNLKSLLVYEIPDIRATIVNTYNAPFSRLETHYTFERGSRREERRQWHWVYTVGETHRMLSDCGLAPVASYSSVDREPLKLGDQDAILVSQRSG
jgi:SAM-dependent methyltransferase